MPFFRNGRKRSRSRFRSFRRRAGFRRPFRRSRFAQRRSFAARTSFRATGTLYRRPERRFNRRLGFTKRVQIAAARLTGRLAYVRKTVTTADNLATNNNGPLVTFLSARARDLFTNIQTAYLYTPSQELWLESAYDVVSIANRMNHQITLMMYEMTPRRDSTYDSPNAWFTAGLEQQGAGTGETRFNPAITPFDVEAIVEQYKITRVRKKTLLAGQQVDWIFRYNFKRKYSWSNYFNTPSILQYQGITKVYFIMAWAPITTSVTDVTNYGHVGINMILNQKLVYREIERSNARTGVTDATPNIIRADMKIINNGAYSYGRPYDIALDPRPDLTDPTEVQNV